MKFKELAVVLSIVSSAVGVAFGDEPPDDTIVEQILKESGFGRMTDDSQDLVARNLQVEAAVLSERLSGPGVVYIRKTKKFTGVGADTGVEVPEYLEIRKANTVNANGELTEAYYYREVPPAEARRLAAEENDDLPFTPDEFGEGLMMGGVAWAAFAETGPGIKDDSGLAVRSAAAQMSQGCSPDDIGKERLLQTQHDVTTSPPSWATPNPVDLMKGQACFLFFAGSALQEAADLAEESKAKAAEDFAEAREIAFQKLIYLGLEPVRGHPSHGIQTAVDDDYAAALAITADSDARYGNCQPDFDSMEVWIDAETFVRRKLRFDGVLTCEGQPQNFCIERIFDDYRNVPNSTLYEPYQEILRICGMMTPEQLEEIRQAEAELGDYETQLSQLPPNQQAMMRRMIEPQVERLRNLSSGNAAEFEVITTSIEIDPAFGDSNATPARVDDQQTQVVRIVQIHLQTLGYTPGNTNGELDRRTVVAIVQFQNDNGLDVTGEATPQLAGMLAAKVDAL